jgi:Flp pilus assembly protein TadG
MRFHLSHDERGAAAVEMAFALPVLIVMLWAFVQLAQVYRAVAGIQMALGEGARYATLCLTQSATGCTPPTGPQIQTKINASIYGLGPGTFTVNPPVSGFSGAAKYYDLTVSYSQPTDLLMFPGPTMALTRSKRVWVATGTT